MPFGPSSRTSQVAPYAWNSHRINRRRLSCTACLTAASGGSSQAAQPPPSRTSRSRCRVAATPRCSACALARGTSRRLHGSSGAPRRQERSRLTCRLRRCATHSREPWPWPLTASSASRTTVTRLRWTANRTTTGSCGKPRAAARSSQRRRRPRAPLRVRAMTTRSRTSSPLSSSTRASLGAQLHPGTSLPSRATSGSSRRILTGAPHQAALVTTLVTREKLSPLPMRGKRTPQW
mmetsp:Transcript_8103/g.23846  ORF Transcript_8103/g.23846 Transcript_8103/m.23846 type:complete len:235 (-) Transcript_8103:135-839(-)